MTRKTKYFQSLRPWYSQLVRKFLQKQQLHDKVAALDADAELLGRLASRLSDSVPVCFLGSSGVGKSTLINSVVAGDGIVVPSGGVGPLTARELKIEYGERRAITAIYHEPVRLWRLAWGLEQSFKEELTAHQNGDMPNDLMSFLPSGLDAEDAEEADDVIQGMTKAETNRKQATLIVTGKQDTNAPLTYVLDSLREAIGKKRIYGTALLDEDRSRIKRLHAIFAADELGTASCYECSADDPGFAAVIKDHATGYLAPLVAELNVRWDSDLLSEGIQLIDLPGLGVAGDVYRRVTDDWIRKKAQIVVLVVDSRGIRESDADLLRSSGFLGRFLHASDDPAADPVSLVVAVVKVDDIAASRRKEDNSKKRLEHFLDIREETKHLLTGQLRDRLKDAWLDGAEGGTRESKAAIIERLAAQTPIVPLSAIEYSRLIADDSDDPPFVRSLEQSGVPELMDCLRATVCGLQADRLSRFTERIELFDSEIRSSLRLIQARLSEASATSEQAAKLRGELDAFLQPLREELRTRQGQFRSYLKDVLPSRIETLVAESRNEAAKSIRNYLKRLKDMHWASMRAAVRKGGIHYGRHQIEIPRDFAQAFEEPIADVWSKKILKEIRQRTREFADDCESLVHDLAMWCAEYSDLLSADVIDAQLEAIKLDSKKLTTIGKEMVDELRENVREKLLKSIEVPIRRKFTNFLKRNADYGPGVKVRMHELMDDLLDDSLDSAVDTAKDILMKNYQDVEQEIRKAFADYQDPLATIVNTFLDKFEAQEDKAEQLRRREVLMELSQIVENAPDSEINPVH